MRRNEGPSINGPYAHGRKWRLVVRRESPSAPGTYETAYDAYETRADAERVKDEFLKEAKSLPVSDAIDRYVARMTARGLKPTTTKTAWHKLRAFFGTTAGKSGGPIHALTAAKAKGLYRAYQVTVKVDTHRNTLAEAKSFGKWAVAEGLLRNNPFADVEGEGRRKKGKPQLRIDEARRYQNTCFRFAELGDVAAVAAVMPLLLGLRASEVVERTVRDLDDGGRVLQIPEAKTYAGVRKVGLPPVLQGYLAKLAKGKRPTDRLFPDATRYWLSYHVERMCSEAKVPTICPHGLRGTHASLAIAAGATSHQVANMLGHSRVAVTHAHYVAGGTLEQSLIDNATDVLQ